VLGQDRFDTFSVNLIEGREFAFVSQNAQGTCGDAALAIDSTGDTPHLYVTDPCNNRVLGFNDARKLTPGAKADIVIGQPDMQTALCNYPSGDVNQPRNPISAAPSVCWWIRTATSTWPIPAMGACCGSPRRSRIRGCRPRTA